MSDPLLMRLTAAIQARAQRAVLSSAELSRLEGIARARVPEERLLSWLHEALEQRNARGERVSLSQGLSVLERRAQQWAEQHAGERYEREQLTTPKGHEELEALRALLESVHTASRERATTQTSTLFSWLIARLEVLVNALGQAQAQADASSFDLSARLEELDEALYAEVLARVSPALISRVEAECLRSLRGERNRSRPQDFARALRAVTWAHLRAELHLPPLHLKLYGGW
jgi:hypothetical protein